MKTIERLPKQFEWYPMANQMIGFCEYTSGTMSFNAASTILGLVSQVNKN